MSESSCYDRSNCARHCFSGVSNFLGGAVGNRIDAYYNSHSQEMRCFLRTVMVNGDWKRCASSTLEVKYQGLCQGNGNGATRWRCTSAGRAAISITTMVAHKSDGQGATFAFVCPFTPSKSIDLIAIFSLLMIHSLFIALWEEGDNKWGWGPRSSGSGWERPQLE